MENGYGRRLLLSEIANMQLENFQTMSAMKSLDTQIQCVRCGFISEKAEVRLPDESFYCPNCINLGRVRSSELLYFLPDNQLFDVKEKVLRWCGQLTLAQQKISDELVANTEDTLVHAVTGAGKTEMIYQVLACVLEAGGHVCLTSPRVDVCIEIFARLKRDFAVPMQLLYADGDDYKRTNLVVCTVHQLMRFYQSFDLMIIDEVDAFPLVNHPSLNWAIEHARKLSARTIYLTATPTAALVEKAGRGEILSLVLDRRFHGKPLVLPKFVWCSSLLDKLKQEKLSGKLRRIIAQQRVSRYPLLLFVPEIRLGLILQKLLKQFLTEDSIGFISSQSNDRKKISLAFKSGEYTVLIATTVLERGVTFSGIDCMVIGSDHRVFTTESLIQIAGRVGRDVKRPSGLLLFFHQGKTQAMVRTLKSIKAMNQGGMR
ncbi:MAG: DEAD/DEAH box helicase [Streptococcaceae bacterium]|jgi:competence protein ComFA|nr:DEAD/DEAH box helicase [Streptococcaceae bacterium]